VDNSAVATRIMRDSTVLADIPVAGTQIVMVYINGAYAASAAAVAARFPGVPVCWLDVLGTDPHADGLDVEPGDAGVLTAVSWTKAKLALKGPYLPLLYADRATLTPMFNALTTGGLQVAKHFRLGIATLDGTKTVPDMTGVTFVQDRGQALTGGHYDENIVYDPAWKAPAAPVPPAWSAQALADAKLLTAAAADFTKVSGALEQLLTAHQ
jgi:hypothetical protein